VTLRAIVAGSIDTLPGQMAVTAEEADRSSERVDLKRLFARARILRPWVQGLIAYLVYQAIAIVLWAIPILGDPAHRILGIEVGDTRFYEWALRWTPWALEHGRNPIFSDRIFAPAGMDLARTTFIPGPALVMYPITRVFGPLVSYNILMALGPALAAWAAYLVCHRVTRTFWPSLLGGYLFGFSTYMVGQMHEHVNLVLIFPVPLAVYLVVRRVEGSIGIVAFVGYLALTLIGLCSIMPETFATATLFGFLAFACALAVAGRDRSRMFRVGLEVALAYGIAAVALLPYLVSFLHHVPGLSRLRPAETGSIDMLSPLLPRPGTVFGSAIPLLRITDRFPLAGLPAEDAGYVGVALVLMVVLFVVSERKRRETWGLLGFVLFVTVLSFGSSLYLAGRRIGTGLGVMITHAPLLLNAGPPRFPAYSALALGVIAAIWLAHARPSFGWLRWAVVVLGAAALLPAIPQPPFYPTESLPPFITEGTFRYVLQPDEIVFPIVPMTGDELRWQQAADFSFRLPIAYIGAISARQRVYQYLLAMRRKYMPSPSTFLKWLQGTGVTSVLLDDEARGRFEPLLRETGLEEVYTGGGVSVWRQPPGGSVPHALPVVTVAGSQAVTGGSVRELGVPALDASGRFTLSQDAGRSLVMTFYTEACDWDPHLIAMQRFHMAHPEARALAIDSFTVSKHVRNVVEALGLTYDVGVDRLGRIAQSFAHPSPLPFTVMLAPDGRVVNIVDGALDEAGFESLFNDGKAQESLPVDPYG
jgi:hypothetical protein